MNSIHANQPEDTRNDLVGQRAIVKIKELVEKADTCFFCTASLRRDGDAARPMSVRQVDDDGNLWFLSAHDSHKNRELTSDPTVQLFFQGSAHSDFMALSGVANICYDKTKLKELWSPFVKTWFTEGIDDPRITIIKVTPIEGYYWDTKHGGAIAGIKIMIGAAIGRTLDDSIEGHLRM